MISQFSYVLSDSINEMWEFLYKVGRPNSLDALASRFCSVPLHVLVALGRPLV
jgi:hypothetical protein